jgi:hypothetical protein
VIQKSVEHWVIEGSINPSVVVAGHSHILSLLGGLHSSAQLQQMPLAVQYSSDKNFWPNINDDYWSLLCRIHEVETVVICWNGNQHNAQFLLESVPPISVHQNFQTDAKNSKVVVPLSMFDELWQPDFKVLERAIGLVSSSKKVILIGTPPPKSESEIRNHLKSDEFFISLLENAGIRIEDAPITSDNFRFTLWKRIQQNLERIARVAGVPFVPVPSEVFDNDMTLKSECSAPDASHANHLYGQAMWKALLKRIVIEK